MTSHRPTSEASSHLAATSRFLRTCAGQPTDAAPVWFMRQAGRYMKEYRALRARYSLLELCRNPELATEVTLQPVRAFDVDAAILFADLLLPFEPMGAPFEFAKGEGPIVHRPVESAADVERLRVIDPEEELGFVLSAIGFVKRELGARLPLIGFAGAPFTLASYLLEGGKSSHLQKTRRMMLAEPELFSQLLGKLAQVVERFLLAQIAAGVDAVQLFDSWVGVLAPADYERFVLPHTAPLCRRLMETGVPLIHFGTGTQLLLPLQQRAGGSVMGVDFRTPLNEAIERLAPETVVQGNLDPVSLLAPRPILLERIRDVLARGRLAKAHIFNVGHGIVPETDPDDVAWAVDRIHEESRR